MNREMLRTIALLACTAAWIPQLAVAQGFQPCGDIRNPFGPFDYRTATTEAKQLVEGTHFTTQVETLVRGNAATIGGDIDYTLRAFPNNPRALLAMKRLGDKEKREKAAGAKWPVACYFDRAIRFAPDDPAVRLVYGIYLVDKGDSKSAREQLALAHDAAKNDANISYNLGLAYLDLKDYDLAREHAKRAYELGFPLGGLKKKLQAAGQWRD